MILYNVTVNVDIDIEQEWTHWMKTHHIPNVISTGQFIDYKIYKLLNEQENEGTTYSIQYFAKSLTELNLYFEKYAPALIQEHLDRYRHKHVAFRTVLEEVV